MRLMRRVFVSPTFSVMRLEGALPFRVHGQVVVLGDHEGEPGMPLIVFEDDVAVAGVRDGDEQVDPLVEEEVGAFGLGGDVNLGRGDAAGEPAEQSAPRAAKISAYGADANGEPGKQEEFTLWLTLKIRDAPRHSRYHAAAASSQLTVTVLGSGTSQGVPMIGCNCAVCQSTDPRDKRTRSSIFSRRRRPSSWSIPRRTCASRPCARASIISTRCSSRIRMRITSWASMTCAASAIYRAGRCRSTARRRRWQQFERIFFYAFNPKKLVPGLCSCHPACGRRDRSSLGGLEITPLPVPHGAVSTLGFLFAHGGRKLLAYLSDCAAVPEPVRRLIEGVEVLIIDGLRDKPHPTHLTVRGAVAGGAGHRREAAFLTHQTHEKTPRRSPAAICRRAWMSRYDGMKLEFDLDSPEAAEVAFNIC